MNLLNISLRCDVRYNSTFNKREADTYVERLQILLIGHQNKRKTWKGIMIRNVLTRRREYGTYLATARRHRRRLKMQKRDE